MFVILIYFSIVVDFWILSKDLVRDDVLVLASQLDLLFDLLLIIAIEVLGPDILSIQRRVQLV